MKFHYWRPYPEVLCVYDRPVYAVDVLKAAVGKRFVDERQKMFGRL